MSILGGFFPPTLYFPSGVQEQLQRQSLSVSQQWVLPYCFSVTLPEWKECLYTTLCIRTVRIYNRTILPTSEEVLFAGNSCNSSPHSPVHRFSYWEAIAITCSWLISNLNSSLIMRVKSSPQEKSTAPSLIFFLLKTISKDIFFFLQLSCREADLHWSAFTFGWSDVASCAVWLGAQRANSSHLAWDWDGVVIRLIH